ncbi:hypothetical protein ACQ4PT_048627 [Festuca glaucescens]
MGELVSRSISFLVDRYLKQKSAPTEEERLRNLQRLLLRLRVIVEEADGWLITNQAMLHQLSILKKEMYTGYYTLDVFSCQARGKDMTKDHEVNNSFAPSVFNPAKRVHFCSGNNEGVAQAELLEQVLGSIRGTIEDLNTSVETLRDGGRIKHQNSGMGGGRTLIIIELVLDIEESVWKRLYSAARSCIMSGSKIIAASRSDKIARFGTTQPLRLQLFTREAYWYFFKVRTFGSTRVEDHPKLAAMAMEMARLMNRCFMGAAMISGLLKANFSPRFWSMTLATLRNIKRKKILLYGKPFADPWQMAEPVYVRRARKTSSECFVILADYQTCSAETEPEAPKMMSMQDILFGRVRPRENFKVHAWTSHLPPYYNYMFHCGIQRPQHMIARTKH